MIHIMCIEKKSFGYSVRDSYRKATYAIILFPIQSGNNLKRNLFHWTELISSNYLQPSLDVEWQLEEHKSTVWQLNKIAASALWASLLAPATQGIVIQTPIPEDYADWHLHGGLFS